MCTRCGAAVRKRAPPIACHLPCCIHCSLRAVAEERPLTGTAHPPVVPAEGNHAQRNCVARSVPALRAVRTFPATRSHIVPVQRGFEAHHVYDYLASINADEHLHEPEMLGLSSRILGTHLSHDTGDVVRRRGDGQSIHGRHGFVRSGFCFLQYRKVVCNELRHGSIALSTGRTKTIAAL